jgi:hypothetical protein
LVHKILLVLEGDEDQYFNVLPQNYDVATVCLIFDFMDIMMQTLMHDCLFDDLQKNNVTLD